MVNGKLRHGRASGNRPPANSAPSHARSVRGRLPFPRPLPGGPCVPAGAARAVEHGAARAAAGAPGLGAGSGVPGARSDNLASTLSPRRIVIGGGVPQQPCLLPMVRAELARLLGGYIEAAEIIEEMESFVYFPSSATAQACWGRWRRRRINFLMKRSNALTGRRIFRLLIGTGQ